MNRSECLGTVQPELMRRPDSSDETGQRPFQEPRDDEGEGEILLPDSLGARLRAQRLSRKVSIASIAESTKILGALLEALEHDDVSRWPSGLYRRAFIRAYASAIGLDPERVVREFLERFPDPEAVPAPALEAGHNGPALRSPRSALRLTLADHGLAFAPKEFLDELRRRCSAVAFDAFVLSVVGLAMFLAIGVFWAPLAVAAGLYYFGSILALGGTPGVLLFAPRPRRGGTIRLLTDGAGGLAGRLRDIFHPPNRKPQTVERPTH